MRECIEGVDVIRFPMFPSHDRSPIKRIFSYLSLAASMCFFAPWVVRKANIAYVIQGPATLGMPAITLKFLRGIPFVYQIQDMWPDSLTATGMFKSKAGLKFLHAFCKLIYKHAKHIAVITPGMKRTLVSRGVRSDKISVVYNWCHVDACSDTYCTNQVADEIKGSNTFNILYAGNMGPAQDLESVIEAAEIVAKLTDTVRIIFVGPGVCVKDLKAKSEKLELTNVLFYPAQDQSKMKGILESADVLLVHLKKNDLFRITIPSKTQAYLAVGKPILMAVEGDAANIITETKAGLVAEPSNPASIAETIIQFSALKDGDILTMGKNAKDFYNREMSFEIGIAKLESLLKDSKDRK